MKFSGASRKEFKSFFKGQSKKNSSVIIYTFEDTEWAIEDPEKKKRLEIILSPLKNSITVFSINDAEKLLNKGIQTPILVAHTKGKQCYLLNIKGDYSEFRSTIIEEFQKESLSLHRHPWGPGRRTPATVSEESPHF